MKKVIWLGILAAVVISLVRKPRTEDVEPQDIDDVEYGISAPVEVQPIFKYHHQPITLKPGDSIEYTFRLFEEDCVLDIDSVRIAVNGNPVSEVVYSL